MCPTTALPGRLRVVEVATLRREMLRGRGEIRGFLRNKLRLSLAKG